jgi:hypothetical protein
MSYENTQIVHPGSGKEDIFIEWLITRETLCQLKEAGLMAELVRRVGLRADKFDDSIAIGHGRRILRCKTPCKSGQKCDTTAVITARLRA